MALLHRWGPVAVTLAYLTVGVQTAVFAGSGLIRMPYARFTLASLPGAVGWAIVWATAGLGAVWAALALAARSPWALVAALVVLVGYGPSRPWTSPALGVGGTSTAAVMGAVSVAVLSFLGFDAIASFAEENTGDERQVGRAVLFCLGVAGLLFVASTYLAGLLMPVSPKHLAAMPAEQGTAFYDMTRSAIGSWMQKAFAVVKGIGPAFTAMASVAAASRLIYGMARDRGLPRALASVDERSHVPRTALLTTAAVSLVVSVWAARRHDGLDVLVSVVNMGALAAFTLLHVSVIGYFVVRNGSRLWVPHLVVPLAGAAVSIWIMVSATSAAKLIAAIWLAAGAVVFVVAGRRGPVREYEREHV